MAKLSVKSAKKTLDIIKKDPWLKDYEQAIEGRLIMHRRKSVN